MTTQPLDAPATDSAPQRARPRRRRRLLAPLGVVVLVAVAGAVVLIVQPFAHGAGAKPIDNATPTGLATVQRRTLTSQDSVSGTLGYIGTYTILNPASGNYTRLPAVGDVIVQGQVAYRVNETPVILLYGPVPLYRALSEGMTGVDVRELNHALVTLGYAKRSELDPTSDYFSGWTAYALELLQEHYGLTVTGTLPLGEVIFEPGAVRIVSVNATLGGQAGPGPFAQATSTDRQVTVALDTAQQGDVKVGDPVSITLPSGNVTDGVISRIGTVASSESGNNGGGGSSGSGSTINVYVRLLHPRDAAGLDSAPVQVSITTGTAANALVVPVNALLALAGGGYAVELVDASGVHHLVRVTVGLFDDAEGLVQVNSSGLSAGQRVVVPANS